MRVLSLFWRPVSATVVMYLAIAGAATRVEPSLGALVGAIAAGAAVYAAALIIFWLAAGRPAGPEKIVADRFVLPAWRRLTSGAARV